MRLQHGKVFQGNFKDAAEAVPEYHKVKLNMVKRILGFSRLNVRAPSVR